MTVPSRALLTDAEHVKRLVAVNQRQADMIDRLEKALNQTRRSNAELRRRLEAHDMAQATLRVGDRDPLGRDRRQS